MIRYIDISVEFEDGEDGKIQPHPMDELPVYCGHKCTAFDITVKSHHGTYYETSSHVFRDGKDTIEVPVEEFFLPVSIVKLTGQGAIEAGELDDAGKDVQPGDALLIHCPDKKRYFALDAVKWMIAKKIRLLGSDLPKYDTGFVNPTGMFVELFKADIPIIANIERLDKIPVNRARLVVLPLKVAGVGAVPCRAIVITED